MLFRVVRPMQRKESRHPYFVKRIPADLRGRMARMTLHFPLGNETQAVAVSPRAERVQFSLRTADPSAFKIRQAEAEGYFDNVCQGLRADAPISLDHKHAVALTGELYRAWTAGEGC